VNQNLPPELPGAGPRPAAPLTADRAAAEAAERQRATRLSIHAPLHAPHGALRRGLQRGMLAASPEEQATLEAVAARLWGRGGTRSVAIRVLIRSCSGGSVGAAGVLAALGDTAALRALATPLLDPTAPQPRRLAALRCALVAGQANREQGAPAPPPLMAAVRRAARSEDVHVRYTAAFVLAMMGRREVRQLLQHGLFSLPSAALLSYCVLGLREIGNGASSQALRRILPHLSGQLADLAHEAIQTIELRLLPPVAGPHVPTIRVADDEFHSRPTIKLDAAALRN
jgi:HEAT repeat protein